MVLIERGAPMSYRTVLAVSMTALVALAPHTAAAEILAMMNYETKSPESLASLSLSAPGERREGIAVIDVDPESERFGDIIMDIPLPPDLVAHHIFYDRTMTKAYVTALGKPELRVIDMTRNPYRIKVIAVPDCQVGEDVIFSGDNATWYLTCMGTGVVVVGDTATDAVRSTVKMPIPYPHGLAVHQGIDRYIVTSTVNPADLGDPGEAVSVVKASTHEVLGTIKVSDKPSPAGEAPVEALFIPGANPPVAYVTNMYGATLWALVWDPARQDFDARKAFDFATVEAGVPLEMYVNAAGSRFYVTTAKPGKLHIFDLAADPAKPTLRKTLDIAEGAHHVAITKDERYAFVQNALLNLPGMSDGAITVVDLRKEEVVASVDTLKNAGFNPNSIVLLPEWNSHAGH
jgi:DNA-binding beta-propeller fold protein YncE